MPPKSIPTFSDIMRSRNFKAAKGSSGSRCFAVFIRLPHPLSLPFSTVSYTLWIESSCVPILSALRNCRKFSSVLQSVQDFCPGNFKYIKCLEWEASGYLKLDSSLTRHLFPNAYLQGWRKLHSAFYKCLS